MLVVKNVTKTIKKKQILKDITCEFSHKIYGILGENGAGKTTLIRCMADVLQYDCGQILWEDVGIGGNQEYKRKLGYLPQKLGVIPDLTVYQLMEFYAALKCIPKEEVEKEIITCLSQVGLENRRRDKASILSGGMVRRLGIAQALLGSPEILLFDEATAGLDPEERIRFKSIISLVAQHRTVIISTHVVDEIESLCDRILVMHEGKMIADCTSEELKKYAADRIYEIDAQNANDDRVLCTMKQYEADGRIKQRVLTDRRIDGVKQEPTLEEGYLCLIKQER